MRRWATFPDALPELRRAAPSNPYIKFEPDEVEQSIVARFEQQARRWPTNIAVKSARHELTYAALNLAANQLAHLLLQERGSGAEPVGLLVEHGAPMVMALLAVLKAGKFYVPLDPAYPRDRLAYILDDSQAGIVVTSDALVGIASDLAGPNRRVLPVDAVASSHSTENPGLPIEPDAFAYLLYTSGSTGGPKGVIENHRNVLHFTMVRTNSCHIAADDRLAMLLSFSFSGAATPLYCSLLNGAALHLRYVKDTGPFDLARWLVTEQITVCITGAAVFRQLASTLNGSEQFPALRLLRVGGEPVYQRDVEWFRKHFPPGCLLLNSIGSSEMKNFAEYFIGPDTAIEEDLVPIGYAVEDTEIMLLDDDGRAVGLGEIGEIVVKSRFIAPSYWRRPELTEATFQPAPGGGDERLYRTGDLGRQRPDGALVHLGRKDFQVKIRGYRVEMGEIENALLALAGVSRAVVLAREDKPGTRRLVAYIVPREGAGPQIGAWRAALATKLPDYMIPASFVILESLPLTPNGKVDRAKLPPPDRNRTWIETPYAEPRSQLEKLIATFWEEALGLDRVGIHDDFFLLGGDSVTLAMVAARVYAATGIEADFRHFFDHPTLADFAAAIERRRTSGSFERVAHLERISRDAPLPMSFAQERIWRFSQTPEQSAGYTLASSYRFVGPLDVDVLRQCMRFMVHRHEILRTTFAEDNGQPVQRIHPPQPVELPLLDYSSLADAEQRVMLLLSEEARRSFDLDCLPLIRFVLVRTRSEEHWLLRVSHHIVTDGWSWRVYFRELAAIYEAKLAGKSPALPETEPLQYADFAVWQRRALRPEGQVYREAIDWWKERFAGNPQPIELPMRRCDSFRGAIPADGVMRWGIDAETSQRLDRFARTQGATPYIIRLATFVTLLSNETGNADVALGIYVTNRNRVESQEMLGYFANLVTLRLRCDSGQSFAAWLAVVRKMVSETQVRSEIPYERLCDEMRRQGVQVPEIRAIFHEVSDMEPVRFADVDMTRMDGRIETMPWGFSMVFDRRREADRCCACFDARIYDPAGVRGLIDRYVKLLDAVSRHPGSRLDQLPR